MDYNKSLTLSYRIIRNFNWEITIRWKPKNQFVNRVGKPKNIIMLKNILNTEGVRRLAKKEQLSIVGGMCIVYPESECIACGGAPRANGCCLGNALTHECLG